MLAFLCVGVAVLLGARLAHAGTTTHAGPNYDYDHTATFAQGASESSVLLTGSWASAAAGPDQRPAPLCLGIRSGVAAKSGPAVVRGGETAATAYGRAIHKTYNYGPGFEREFALANGRRADAVNLATREVVELKPNNPAAIARGQRQAAAYAEQLTREFPGTPFTWRVETYNRP